ncbi:MAG: STAS domain-containing protein [Planctomycetia bacterium]|nr:STAS domain-containing protein [Planctomycetia bacterium]
MLSYSGHESGELLILTAAAAEAGDGMPAQREWLYKTVASRDDPRFVLDLSEIPFMTSADIGVLITLKRRIDARKGKLVLTNVDPYIVGTLRTMRIDRLFTITPDMTAAVASLSS